MIRSPAEEDTAQLAAAVDTVVRLDSSRTFLLSLTSVALFSTILESHKG
jgi:hypothetical protein